MFVNLKKIYTFSILFFISAPVVGMEEWIQAHLDDLVPSETSTYNRIFSLEELKLEVGNLFQEGNTREELPLRWEILAKEPNDRNFKNLAASYRTLGDDISAFSILKYGREALRQKGTLVDRHYMTIFGMYLYDSEHLEQMNSFHTHTSSSLPRNFNPVPPPGFEQTLSSKALRLLLTHQNK